MRFRKEHNKIHHIPSTHEIFLSLASMISWSKILLKHAPDKHYNTFLEWLIKNEFYTQINEKTSITRIAREFGEPASKITKWIGEIYEDIYQLNEVKKEIFQISGTKVLLRFKHYDDYAIFYYSFSIIPRLYESVKFPFIKPKVGTESFWVKSIDHEIDGDELNVCISLHGGFVNEYREKLLQRAVFENKISLIDAFIDDRISIDKILLSMYH